MSPRIAHRYIAELRLAGGRRLRTPPLAIDWTPAFECLHFEAVRRGAAGLASAPRPACVLPQWDTQDGPPYVAAVLAAPQASEPAAPSHGDSPALAAATIPAEYCADAVRQGVSQLVETGDLAEGEGYTWRLCAFETDAQPAPRSATRFTIEPVGEDDPITGTCRLRALRRASVRYGPKPAICSRRDFPLFIRRAMLDETIEAACSAGDLETGGILLGRIARSTSGSDVVVEVTAQVPAREAIAADASLRFTPRTWQAVEAALHLRRAGERACGWWHSHPRKVWPCHACSAQRRANCPLGHAFFSPQDVGFHRTAFPGPINVALLLSFQDEPRPRHDLFGWRHGLVAAREYYVLEH